MSDIISLPLLLAEKGMKIYYREILEKNIGKKSDFFKLEKIK